MKTALHRAGHRYLKLLFVCALAGSSALFFIGAAIPRPPALLVILIGAGLGIALEWSFFTVTCDLQEAISERNASAIARDGFFTAIGAVSSWFLFTNAALHVGWAPADSLTGLSREQWAGIMGALVVAVVVALSLRRETPEQGKTDLQAIARAVSILLPDAPDSARLRLLSAIAAEAARYGGQALPEETPAPVVQAPPALPVQVPASAPIYAPVPAPESEGASNGTPSFWP